MSLGECRATRSVPTTMPRGRVCQGGWIPPKQANSTYLAVQRMRGPGAVTGVAINFAMATVDIAAPVRP